MMGIERHSTMRCRAALTTNVSSQTQGVLVVEGEAGREALASLVAGLIAESWVDSQGCGCWVAGCG